MLGIAFADSFRQAGKGLGGTYPRIGFLRIDLLSGSLF